ncbi:ABC transporter ATP-binding protein [Bacillus carboniphilus]|uniref:ABC transporter ATP-binding protein n=1 Tax=Bacillus carboniphilus TaxID=86663 RepID=A0ABN0WHH2_9BACI
MEKTRSMTGKEQTVVLKRLLTYAKPHWKMIVAAFGLLLIMTLGDILGPVLVKIFIDDHLTPFILDNQSLAVNALIALGAGFISIQILNAVASYFQLYQFQKIALKIIQAIRVDVFQKVHSLGLKFFDRTPAGSLVSRVTNDTEAIKDMFVSVLISFVQSFFLMIGVFITMFILNVKLALFCLFTLPVLYLIMRSYRKLSSRIYSDLRERLSQLNAKLSESLQGMSIIQVFRQEKRLRKEFEDINNKHFAAGVKNLKVDALLLRPAIDLVYIAALVVVLSFFSITSLNNPVEVGVLYAFITYLDRFFEPVNQVMSRMTFFQQAIVAASRIFTLMDEKEHAPSQLSANEKSITSGDIQFDKVSFSYDGKRDVLKNISFTAKAGETVALVGHTGSGKSSIINLLMRFYEFERGDIKIDGTSIKNLEKNELRDKMGLVLQDPFLFYGTIKENIKLHKYDMTEEEVIEAAKFVQANTFIEKLEDDYDHIVTERGSTFSSGQRQLIAFARTIAYNPQILVLDEATANIDTETEEAIQVALKRMREGRTTIAIAHRLSTIQDAEQILVLHQGEIVERGNHQELLAKKGLYYKMYILQNGSGANLEDAVAQTEGVE